MTDRVNPAIAEAIVVHAEAVCKHEDHLWDVIEQVNIPFDQLKDHREQHKTDFETPEIVRAFLYGHIRGYSQSELENQLTRAALLHSFGFDVNTCDQGPTQQALSHAWSRFSDGTQRVIKSAATGIAQVAVEHDVISEGLAPILSDEEDDEEDGDEPDETAADKRQQATQTIKLARKHAFPEFESGRTINRSYEDEEILDMVARVSAYSGSANSEGEYGWLTDDDLTAHGSTILRVLKKFSTTDELDGDLSVDAIYDDDGMPDIESIRGELTDAFDAARDNIITSLRGGGPFTDRHKTAAIDTTYEQFHVYPWLDRDEGIAKPGFPRMVSGYKDDDGYKRGYKYATITLAGDLAPIILGVEPVKENSSWEEDGSPSYSKAEMVERLLAKAEQIVDLDEVFLDRGFHSKEVYAVIEEYGLTYTAPVPKYEDDYRAIKKIEEHPTADAAVNHSVPVAIDGEIHHHTEYMYVPSRNEDKEGKYAVFITNRDRVETSEIEPVCNRYRRRWDIENQYKSLKECLPRTSSTDYRVRFCNFVLTALLYNLWRLTDYLIKVGRGIDIRSPPEFGFKTFVRAVGYFLREFD